MRVESPIFVVGSSRSGTTLVCHSLRRHPHIYIVNETHYFDDLRPRMMRKLAKNPSSDYSDHAIRYFRRLDANYYRFDGNPDESTIEPSALRSLAEACGDGIDAYFEAYCRIQAGRAQKSRWGEKTPRHVYQLDAMLGRFPRAKVVFMVRDPRAVAASYSKWRKQGFREDDPERVRAKRSYHPLISAFMWRGATKSFRAAYDQHGSARLHYVRYEDLVCSPAQTLRLLCDFLEEPFDEGMLDVPVSNSSFKREGEWAEMRGINRLSLNRWQETLTSGDIATIQDLCGNGMKDFGYDRAAVGVEVLAVARNWITFPFAVVRAMLANRTRIGNMPAYVWRRLRGAPSGR